MHGGGEFRAQGATASIPTILGTHPNKISTSLNRWKVMVFKTTDINKGPLLSL